MRKVLIAVVAIALVASLATTAEAKNEFENGFKTELGAISARAAVGLGFGIAQEVFTGGPYCETRYVPAPRPIVRHVVARPVVRPVVRTVYVERPVYFPVKTVHHNHHHQHFPGHFHR